MSGYSNGRLHDDDPHAAGASARQPSTHHAHSAAPPPPPPRPPPPEAASPEEKGHRHRAHKHHKSSKKKSKRKKAKKGSRESQDTPTSSAHERHSSGSTPPSRPYRSRSRSRSRSPPARRRSRSPWRRDRRPSPHRHRRFPPRGDRHWHAHDRHQHSTRKRRSRSPRSPPPRHSSDRPEHTQKRRRSSSPPRRGPTPSPRRPSSSSSHQYRSPSARFVDHLRRSKPAGGGPIPKPSNGVRNGPVSPSRPVFGPARPPPPPPPPPPPGGPRPTAPQRPAPKAAVSVTAACPAPFNPVPRSGARSKQAAASLGQLRASRESLGRQRGLSHPAKANGHATRKMSSAAGPSNGDGASNGNGNPNPTAGGGDEEQAKPTLRDLLSADAETLELAVTTKQADSAGPDDELADVPPGVCVECEKQPATRVCIECADEYCKMCFLAQHRKGKRAKHTFKERAPIELPRPEASGPGAALSLEATPVRPDEVLEPLSPRWFLERAKYIPVRLKLPERKLLRTLQGVLAVCNYTDLVDSGVFKNKGKRVHQQLTSVCSILSGLVLARDFARGQELVESKAFETLGAYFRTVFELGRRHKIMNPEKMRSDYGKLVYLLQDTEQADLAGLLQFTCVKPIETVYDKFKRCGILKALLHPDIRTATMEILPANKTRPQIQREIKAKERAQDIIAKKYCNREISRDDIKWCLYSIGDNFSYLRCNRFPIDEIIAFLKEYFRQGSFDDGYSLAISGGEDGHRLTHSHSRQYAFVLQSLTLWQQITDDMFRLWYLAEQDLLSADTPYNLKDTGQGKHRMQHSPLILAAMRQILHRTQQSVGSWIGSSVIHLGDTNVPNALMFIDKYTQISRILAPVTAAVKEVPLLMKDPKMAAYITQTWGTARTLQKDILYDFFRYAFDGSGADNFFDAGSCIDGRLTSAWNWCSQLESKPFFPIFKLSGFIGFDGDFQQ